MIRFVPNQNNLKKKPSSDNIWKIAHLTISLSYSQQICTFIYNWACFLKYSELVVSFSLHMFS